MSFVFGVIAYATLISDYGFNLSATAAISVARDDRVARSRVFWETLAVKIALALSCAVAIAIAVPFLPQGALDWKLYTIGFGVVLSGVLTPSWYFQGIERLPILSALTFVTRGAAVPVTLYFVRDASDTAVAMAITVVASGASALLSLAILWIRRELSWMRPNLNGLRETLRGGWHVFMSTAAISLYTNTNAVLLGILTDHRAVAMFVAADKVVKASQLSLAPLSQALYPRISYLMHHERPAAYALIQRSALYIGGFSLALTLGLAVLAPWIIQFLFGRDYSQATAVLRVLSLVPIAVGLSNLFGIQTMLPLGMKREFSAVLVAAGPCNVLLLLVLASSFGARGAAFSVVVTEMAITAAMGIWLWRRQVPIFSGLSALSLRTRGHS